MTFSHLLETCKNHKLTISITVFSIIFMAYLIQAKLHDNNNIEYTFEEENNLGAKKLVTLRRKENTISLWDKYSSESDMVGTVIGLISLVISLYLTEKINQESKKDTQEIKDLTIKIDKALTKIQVIEGYENIINKISEVLSQGKQNNNIHIMNHTASFGYYLTFNYDILQEFSYKYHEGTELSDLSLTEIHKLYEKAHKLYENLFTELTSFGNDMEKDIKYITLCPDTILSSDSSDTEFAEYYLKDILEDTKFINFDNIKSKKLSEDNILKAFQSTYEDNKKNNKKNQLLIFPNSVNSGNNIAEITTFFLREQKEKIKSLKQHKIDVRLFSKGIVPMQIFLTTPFYEQNDPKKHELSLKYKCLIFYINNQTIGKVSSLKAFYTEDKEVVEYFNTIFYSNYQKTKLA